MQIIDLNGMPITVTHLEKAIEQARLFKGFQHTDPAYRQRDKQLQQYWEDIYTKLLALKNS